MTPKDAPLDYLIGFDLRNAQFALHAVLPSILLIQRVEKEMQYANP